jgi:hypothetical protein
MKNISNKKYEKVAEDFIKLFYIQEWNDANFKSMIKILFFINFFFGCIPGIIGIILLFNTKVSMEFLNVFASVLAAYLISYMISSFIEMAMTLKTIKNILKNKKG